MPLLGRVAPIPFRETLDYIPQPVVQPCHGELGDVLRHTAIERPRNTASDASERIGVATEGYRQPDSFLVIGGVEEGDDRFGYCALAGLVEGIGWADVIDGPMVRLRSYAKVAWMN